jgi:hypothetical protein
MGIGVAAERTAEAKLLLRKDRAATTSLPPGSQVRNTTAMRQFAGAVVVRRAVAEKCYFGTDRRPAHMRANGDASECSDGGNRQVERKSNERDLELSLVASSQGREGEPSLMIKRRPQRSLENYQAPSPIPLNRRVL